MAVHTPSPSAARRPLDPDGPEAPAPGRKRYRDTTDYQHRTFVNLAATAALLLIAVAVVWTMQAFEAQQKLQRCIDSGRRDCIDLKAPVRHGVRSVVR